MPIVKESNSTEWLLSLEMHVDAIRKAKKKGDLGRAVQAGRELLATAEIIDEELLREYHLAIPRNRV